MTTETHIENLNMLYQAANLYYEQQFNQQKIADRLGISRPGVSRLLQKARDVGIVRIQVVDPNTNISYLENQLIEFYNLRKVILIPGHEMNPARLNQNLGSAVCDYLHKICDHQTTLAISWGSTMQAVSLALKPMAYRDMTVVQLNGGVSGAQYDTHAAEIVQRVGQRCNAIPYLLQLPAVVSAQSVKDAVLSDRNIAKTLQLANSANIAVFTIGSFGNNSALVKAEYLEKNDVSFLIENGAVGDVCSRIFDANGQIVSEELNNRTIGVELSNISNKAYSIAVAAGQDKVPAIQGALRGGLFNVLVTDEWTGGTLLELAEKSLQNTEFGN